MSCSIGSVTVNFNTFCARQINIGQLMDLADTAMYEATIFICQCHNQWCV